MDYKHDEKDLRQCTASELFPGAVFWVKQDNGDFHKCNIDLGWYKTAHQADRYRKIIKKLSEDGKLYTRRDKAFKHFWQ